MKYTLLKTDAGCRARAGIIDTDHGQIETPIFMPVGTVGSVKGIHVAELLNGAVHHAFHFLALLDHRPQHGLHIVELLHDLLDVHLARAGNVALGDRLREFHEGLRRFKRFKDAAQLVRVADEALRLLNAALVFSKELGPLGRADSRLERFLQRNLRFLLCNGGFAVAHLHVTRGLEHPLADFVKRERFLFR